MFWGELGEDQRKKMVIGIFCRRSRQVGEVKDTDPESQREDRIVMGDYWTFVGLFTPHIKIEVSPGLWNHCGHTEH